MKLIWCFIFASMHTFSNGMRKSFIGYTLFRLHPDTEVKLEFLNSIYMGIHELDVDFWNPPSKVGELVEVFVQPWLKEPFLKELHSHDISFNQTNPNLYQYALITRICIGRDDKISRAMEEERKPVAGGKRRKFKDDSSFQLSQYNTWNDIEKYMKKSASTLRHFVQVRSIGKSHEGRDLLVIKLGNPKADSSPKPAIWIDAGIHAREWIAPATVLYIVDTLAHADEHKDPNTKKYLDQLDWYIMPVMNPDGYAHTHAKDRMWRKNRSPNTGRGCKGVDLNRNFATQWGSTGASKFQCSQTYMGTKAFSEPESKAVRDFVMENANSIKAFFTFHSYGQLWMYPYGYKKRTYPDDVDELKELSEDAVQALQSVHGTRYKVGTAANILYSASGASEDWAKAEAKIKYSYCVELRPAGFGNGFILSPRHITSSGEEIWAAMKVVANKMIEKYGAVSNPNSNMTIQNPLHRSVDSSSGNVWNETSDESADPDQSGDRKNVWVDL